MKLPNKHSFSSNQKGFVHLILIIVIMGVLAVAGGSFWYSRQSSKQTRNDFGCWPPSCSVIPDPQGKQVCEDWKAGKQVQWPSDCSYYSGQPNCQKLCESERQQGTAAKSNAYKVIEQKIAAHKLPSLLTLEFKEGVAKEDEERLREGIQTMDFFLNEWFGHSITRKSAIRVSAASNENKILDEGGTVVAVMGMQEGSELSTIKKYAQYEPFADYRVRYMAHEFVHFYQMGQGCVNIGREGEKFTWFTEGEAEWLSFKAQRESGKLKSDMSVEQWASQGLQQRLQRGISVKPLREYEGVGRFEDVYPYFTLAIEFLMKDKEFKTLDSFCANIGKGQIGSVAFQNAFGITFEKFYEGFEAYRKTW